MHNLRASLDHVAWQLATKQSGTPSTGTEFPIFRDSREYHARDRRRRPTPWSGLYKVRGMAPAAQTLIESLQPYHTPKPDLTGLWVVHTLDIIGKHRVIKLVTVTQREAEWTIGTIDGSECPPPRLEMFPLVPFEHDAVVCIVHINPPNPKGKVDLDGLARSDD